MPCECKRTCLNRCKNFARLNRATPETACACLRFGLDGKIEDAKIVLAPNKTVCDCPDYGEREPERYITDADIKLGEKVSSEVEWFLHKGFDCRPKCGACHFSERCAKSERFTCPFSKTTRAADDWCIHFKPTNASEKEDEKNGYKTPRTALKLIMKALEENPPNVGAAKEFAFMGCSFMNDDRKRLEEEAKRIESVRKAEKNGVLA